jgi:hypothetical protein
MSVPRPRPSMKSQWKRSECGTPLWTKSISSLVTLSGRLPRAQSSWYSRTSPCFQRPSGNFTSPRQPSCG